MERVDAGRSSASGLFGFLDELDETFLDELDGADARWPSAVIFGEDGLDFVERLEMRELEAVKPSALALLLGGACDGGLLGATCAVVGSVSGSSSCSSTVS